MIILVAGFVIGGWVGRALSQLQERSDVDVTLRHFIASAARLVVITLFVIIVFGKLGISIPTFIAALNGLAIQGPILNYGTGFIIILTCMSRVGDIIPVQ